MDPGECGNFFDKGACGDDADGNGLSERLLVVFFQPLCRREGDLGIEHNVEVGLAETGDVLGRGA